MYSATIILNSKDASVSSGTYTWNINDPFIQKFNEFSMSFHKFIIPNLVYPINTTNNVMNMYYKSAGGAVTSGLLQINPGNYSATTLATGITTLLNTLISTSWAVTYNTTYSTFTITLSDGGTFYLGAATNSIYNAMGFTVIPGTYATSYTGAGPAILTGANTLFVQTNLAGRTWISENQSGFAISIPMSASYGEVMFYEAYQDNTLYLTDSYLPKLEITFYDENYNIWSLPSNVYFTAEFRISATNYTPPP